MLNVQSDKSQNPRTPQPSKNKNNQANSDNKATPPIAQPPQGSSEPSTKTTEKPRNNHDWSKFFPDRFTDWLLVVFTGLLALFTYFLWDSTYKLWKSGEQQIVIATDAANAAKKSAEVAEKTLFAIHRPWISVKLQVGSELQFNEREATINIVAKMKNIGNSPAISTFINTTIFPLSPKRNWRNEQQKVLDGTNRMKIGPDLIGYTIFPGEEITQNIAIVLDMEDIKQSQLEIVQESKNKTIYNFIHPVLVGCAYYQFPSDMSVHKTTFMANIERIDPATGHCLAIDITRGNVPMVLLSLTQDFIGSFVD
jgi:hypothetical protein